MTPTVLLVADGPDALDRIGPALRGHGYAVVPCGGGPIRGACPLLRTGRCGLVDIADVVVFASSLDVPLPGRTYRGRHVFAAYRRHPGYGRRPMVLVAPEIPLEVLTGRGELVHVRPETSPDAIVAAVDTLLAPGRELEPAS